jgi:hypothetical protein
LPQLLRDLHPQTNQSFSPPSLQLLLLHWSSPQPSKSTKTTFSLLCSSTGTAAILDSKIKQLRAGNIALMSSATIRTQQTGGTCFLLERLYEIALSEEKKARCLFAKKTLMTTTPDTATAMNSITDTDGFNTLSPCGGGSFLSPPKQRPQKMLPPPPK